MASSPPIPSSPTTLSLSLLLLLLLLPLFFAVIADEKPKHEFELAKETKTHLHFYFHDIVSGPNATAIRVAQAPNMSHYATGFGAVVMIDDPLTEGPEPGSKLIGRAQGIYALASQEEAGLLMTMNFAFVDGEFNGSTLAVFGRNTVFSGVREMPVVGGSGKFRLARGYALAKTYLFNLTNGDTIVEYNVHVLHH